MNPARILVVDDEASIREVLTEYLSGFGYEVVAAADGEEALRKFVAGRFDCIVTDLSMPRIDGLELIQRVRQQDKGVQILVITGYPAIDSAVHAMKHGAYDYISKPFHMEDLYLKIERAIHAHKTETSLKRSKSVVLTLVVLIPALLLLALLYK